MLTTGEPRGIVYGEFFVLFLQRFCKSGMIYKQKVVKGYIHYLDT